MPDDHSKLVPLLPIPNRTVKRLCADDSAGSRVKVGHRQALIAQIALLLFRAEGRFVLRKHIPEIQSIPRPLAPRARFHWHCKACKMSIALVALR